MEFILPDQVISISYPMSGFSVQELETISQLCPHCPFAKEVWQKINIWRGKELYKTISTEKGDTDWWNDNMGNFTERKKKR
ncbi:hypothetical protein EJB05_38038, partial [Eragrostis curvula]